MEEKAKTKELQVSEALSESQAALFGIVYVLMGGSQDAMDVFQETNLAILQNAPLYNPSMPLRNWFRMVATQQVIAYRRKRHSEKLVFDSDLVGLLSETLAEGEGETESKGDAGLKQDVEYLNDCMMKLPDWQRDLLKERYDDRRRVDEMAKARHVTRVSFSVLMYRIRKALQDCITKHRKAATDDHDSRDFIVNLESALDGDAPRGVLQHLADLLKEDSSLRFAYVQHAKLHALMLFQHRALFADAESKKTAFPAKTVAAVACLVALFSVAAFLARQKQEKPATARQPEQRQVVQSKLELRQTVAQVAAAPVPAQTAQKAPVSATTAVAGKITTKTTTKQEKEAMTHPNPLPAAALAVATAAAILSPPAVLPVAASDTPYAGRSSASTLDTRPGTSAGSGASALDARFSTVARSAAHKLNTKKFHGFVIMLK